MHMRIAPFMLAHHARLPHSLSKLTRASWRRQRSLLQALFLAVYGLSHVLILLFEAIRQTRPVRRTALASAVRCALSILCWILLHQSNCAQPSLDCILFLISEVGASP